MLQPPIGAGSAMHAPTAGGCAHTWACPVIMKTVPDCVAWTCARCGAIATTPIGLAPVGATDAGGVGGELVARPRFAA
jgi:hypothetical protein